jgi:hypothetical protein
MIFLDIMVKLNACLFVWFRDQITEDIETISLDVIISVGYTIGMLMILNLVETDAGSLLSRAQRFTDC